MYSGTSNSEVPKENLKSSKKCSLIFCRISVQFCLMGCIISMLSFQGDLQICHELKF